MAKRLVESYGVGERVELFFADDKVEEWRAGRIVGLQHPAVWVQTDADRKFWFVTNGRRIRPQVSPGPHPAAVTGE